MLIVAVLSVQNALTGNNASWLLIVRAEIVPSGSVLQHVLQLVVLVLQARNVAAVCAPVPTLAHNWYCSAIVDRKQKMEN